MTGIKMKASNFYDFLYLDPLVSVRVHHFSFPVYVLRNEIHRYSNPERPRQYAYKNY